MEPTDTTSRVPLDKTATAPTAGVPPFPDGLPYGLDPLGTATPDRTEQRPEPASAPPRFALRRSRTDRMIGGVCGGAARSFGVDPALLRVALVLLTVFGAGAGVVVYVAAWILAPEEDLAPPTAGIGGAGPA